MANLKKKEAESSDARELDPLRREREEKEKETERIEKEAKKKEDEGWCTIL